MPAADQLSGRSRQGYWCNIRPVSSNDMGGIGADIQLAWYGECAYESVPKAGTASDHSGKLSPDGTLYYATDIGNGAVAPNGPCLSIIDLRDPAAPFLLTRWGDDFPCHDLDLSADGNRAYVGFYGAGAGHPAAVVAAFTPAGAPSNLITGLRVVDVSEAQAHRPEPELRIVGVSDETAPVQVGTVDLEINTAPQCGRQVDRNGDVLLHMGHCMAVDDPADAKLLFVTWYASGLRVFDISDPRRPREVAYYNPPVGEGASRTHDWTSTCPRYLPKTGQIWFGSRVTGFNVVELHPALRPRKGGASVDAAWSAPARQDVVVATAGARAIPDEAPPPSYCTLR